MNKITNPLKYWEVLNKENREQLEEFGYENFKRTVALNYFTWTIAGPSAYPNYLIHIFRDPQVKFLIDHLPLRTIILDIFRSFKKHDLFTWTQSIAYNFFTNFF